MLSMNKYDQSYIDACRASVERQITAYDGLTKVARDLSKDGEAPLDEAIAAFEPLFFNNMVLVLDALFCHRSRTMEGKDGNPLNEVRVLASSIMANDGLLVVEKSIKLRPDTSLLHYAAGDPIVLNESDFLRLSDAFFAEIERRFR